MACNVTIFTDGAASGNPGPGGYGVVLISGKHRLEISEGYRLTTNNRMELQAAIEGLSAIKKKGCKITLFTDSKYLRDGITKWIQNWKRNRWLTQAKQPVKNIDLWKKLDELIQHHEVKWAWVKGHNGHPENELADQLATKAVPR